MKHVLYESTSNVMIK